MESEKLEDILQLSLLSTERQRERSGVLNVGVLEGGTVRELIIKYSGSLEGLRKQGIEVEELLAGYAVVRLPEEQVGSLTDFPEVEYVEMPKNLQTGLYEAKRVSCILPLTQGSATGGRLSGRGVLVAVLDSGIDFFCRISAMQMGAAVSSFCGIRSWNGNFPRRS